MLRGGGMGGMNKNWSQQFQASLKIIMPFLTPQTSAKKHSPHQLTKTLHQLTNTISQLQQLENTLISQRQQLTNILSADGNS